MNQKVTVSAHFSKWIDCPDSLEPEILGVFRVNRSDIVALHGRSQQGIPKKGFFLLAEPGCGLNVLRRINQNCFKRIPQQPQALVQFACFGFSFFEQHGSEFPQVLQANHKLARVTDNGAQKFSCFSVFFRFGGVYQVH